MKVKFDNVIDPNNQIWWVDIFLPTSMDTNGIISSNNRRCYVRNIGNEKQKNHIYKVVVFHYRGKEQYGGELKLPLPGDIFEFEILAYSTTVREKEDIDLQLRLRDGVDTTYRFRGEELILLVSEDVLHQIIGTIPQNTENWRMP